VQDFAEGNEEERAMLKKQWVSIEQNNLGLIFHI